MRPPAARSWSTRAAMSATTSAEAAEHGSAYRAGDRDAHPRRLLERSLGAGGGHRRPDLPTARGPTSSSLIESLRDGQRISLGEVRLEILATPGHTPESICIVVYEHAGDEIPYGVLTGDTLFVGDVGPPRPLRGVGRVGGRNSLRRCMGRCTANS